MTSDDAVLVICLWFDLNIMKMKILPTSIHATPNETVAHTLDSSVPQFFRLFRLFPCFVFELVFCWVCLCVCVCLCTMYSIPYVCHVIVLLAKYVALLSLYKYSRFLFIFQFKHFMRCSRPTQIRLHGFQGKSELKCVLRARYLREFVRRRPLPCRDPLGVTRLTTFDSELESTLMP